MTAVVVATTLVSEARSKTVSSDHRLGQRDDGAVAERLLVDHGVAAADHHDRPRRLAGGDGLLDDRVDAGEPGRIQAGRAGPEPAGRAVCAQPGPDGVKTEQSATMQRRHGASRGWPSAR